MFLFKRFEIRSYEMGLYFRDGEFKGLIGEGKHWVFDPLGKIRVEIVSQRDPWLVHEKLDVIVKSGALKDCAVVLDLKDHERGLVWIDNRFNRILAPGLYALWTTVREMFVEPTILMPMNSAAISNAIELFLRTGEHDQLCREWNGGTIGAGRLDGSDRHIVGLSVDTTCYVSTQYFSEENPFADFLVHEAAHVFHNCKRSTAGLPETRRRQWLLPIDFNKRETFAYACEAYSRIVEQYKRAAERRRYRAGLSNFFELYHPIASEWRMYDNSQGGRMKLIAAGQKTRVTRVALKGIWKSLRKEFGP